MSRGLGKLQTTILAALANSSARGIIPTPEQSAVGRHAFGLPTYELANTVFGEWADSAQQSSVRRAVRRLTAGGHVEVKQCGYGTATWNEVRLAETPWHGTISDQTELADAFQHVYQTLAPSR